MYTYTHTHTPTYSDDSRIDSACARNPYASTYSAMRSSRHSRRGLAGTLGVSWHSS